MDREQLGREVWDEFVRSRREINPNWDCRAWEALEERERELYRRTGERLFAIGAASSAAVLQDWTVGPEGRSNTSARFLKLMSAVERLILDSGHDLIHGRANTVARVIMAQLAHVHGLAPKDAVAPVAAQEAP
jgi:hypothetical protein